MYYSDNYYLRNHYLNTETVPTQSVVKNKMGKNLSDIYFKTMKPKLKVLVGLEPQMEGGGSIWYVPPKELLQGKAKLTPINSEHLHDLSWSGIDKEGQDLFTKLHKSMKEQRETYLLAHTIYWQNEIEKIRSQQWTVCAIEETKTNLVKLNAVFDEFSILYRTSLTKIEEVLRNGIEKEIAKYQSEAFIKMQSKYEFLLKNQAAALCELYDKKMMARRAKLKSQFIKNLENVTHENVKQIHDLQVDKYISVEKCRKYLECQKLACQIYVALKEHEHSKEMEECKYQHNKVIKFLTREIRLKDFEIDAAHQKETKRQDFNTAWQNKIRHTLNMFQRFVTYSLKAIPDHAEFFINLERLVLLQLSEASANASVESMFVEHVEQFHTPVPRPRPFYLFYDKSYKPKFDQDLCPKHCTSSASQMPVIVINKRFMYAACNNYQQLDTNQIKNYEGSEEEYGIEDYHDYSRDIPMKCTESQLLQELKIESSLLQLLQQEFENVRKMTLACDSCKIPHCFNCDRFTPISSSISSDSETMSDKSLSSSSSTTTPSPMSSPIITTREAELKHERQPKWDSYFEFIKSKKCECSKTAKKHLFENLPVYMRKMSKYEPPEMRNYEMCSVATLKTLVKEAKGRKTPPPASIVPLRAKEISTQYSDEEFDRLCTCYSDNSLKLFLDSLKEWCELPESSRAAEQFRLVGSELSTTYLAQENKSFVMDRALSFRRLIEQSSAMKEVFEKTE